jgi:hypothetical protein
VALKRLPAAGRGSKANRTAPGKADGSAAVGVMAIWLRSVRASMAAALASNEVKDKAALIPTVSGKACATKLAKSCGRLSGARTGKGVGR